MWHASLWDESSRVSSRDRPSNRLCPNLWGQSPNDTRSAYGYGIEGRDASARNGM